MNQWLIMLPSGTDVPDGSPLEGALRYTRMDCGLLRAWFQRDGRFVNDQLFAADSRGLAVCDGVVLNLSELKEEYGAEDFTQVLRKSWEETEGAFFKKFAGPFCGAAYDAESGVLTAYANQTGDSFVFYYDSGSFYLVSNDLNLIEAVMRENGLPRSIDEIAARCLLSFGYMVDERTLFQEIKRVLPGEMVRFSRSGGIERSYYHRFSFKARSISFEESIELVDQGFRKAVRRCFEKDREYGAKEHLADLSGGLDSRMTAWVAHDMGYGPFVFLNYCQSGSKELACASSVAEALGGQLFHKQLNDAGFLYEIDWLVDMNYGLSLYCGITGGEQTLRTLDSRRFGLEHSGQVGDAVIGSLSNGSETLSGGQRQIKNSRLIPYMAPDEVLAEHETFEDFALYTRAFLGALSSHFIRRRYFYTVSPFIDPDFFALCMSIPHEYRKGHKLYRAWLKAKYPGAIALPSTHARSYIIAGVRNRLKRAGHKGTLALWKAGLIKRRPKPDPNNMNPLDDWYQTKPELRAFMSNYYERNRGLLDGYPKTKACVDQMYASTMKDKLMALTLLAAVKRYFSLEPS